MVGTPAEQAAGGVPSARTRPAAAAAAASHLRSTVWRSPQTSASTWNKAYEDTTLEKLLAAPVSALAGVGEGDADGLRTAFNISTVGDLGKNKHFRLAQALTLLADGAAQ